MNNKKIASSELPDINPQIAALEAENQKLREAIYNKISHCRSCLGTGKYTATAWGADNPTEQTCPDCKELRAALSNTGEGKS